MLAGLDAEAIGKRLLVDSNALGVQLAVVLSNGRLTEMSYGTDFSGRQLREELLSNIYCAFKPVVAFAACAGLMTVGVGLESTVLSLLPWMRNVDPAVTLLDVLTNRASAVELPAFLAVVLSQAARHVLLRGLTLTQATSVRYDDVVMWLILEEVVGSVLGKSLARLTFEQVIRPADAEGSVFAEILPGDFHRLSDRLVKDGLLSDDTRVPHLALARSAVSTRSVPSFLARSTATGLAKCMRFVGERSAEAGFGAGYDGSRERMFDSGRGQDVLYCPGGLVDLNTFLGGDQIRGSDNFGSYAGGGAAFSFTRSGGDCAGVVIFSGMTPFPEKAHARYLNAAGIFESLNSSMRGE